MELLVTASLLINIVVLVPVTSGMFVSARWAERVYGPQSPARGILLAIYVAITVTSVALLLRPDPKMVFALLVVQIVYKVLTPVTVDTVRHPVVLSNLAIAAFHALTCATLLDRVSA